MKYYGITDRGLIRRNNQDSYVIASNEARDVFAIVADGIGGNLGGDIASRMAVSYLSRVFAETKGFKSHHEVKEWVEREIDRCNTEIFTYGQKRPALKGMGTTLCGAIITKNAIYVINIGDSRAYAWWKDGRMTQLTTDHTLVNDMLMHGELTPEEAENFPRKNVVTNALGVWESVKCDIDVHQEPIDGLLLCSDGLHGYVAEEHIRALVSNRTMDPTLRGRKLLRAALDTGGYDNITIVLIDLEGEGCL